MRQFIAYLAGPITGVSYGECVDWRRDFINSLPKEIIGLSPMRGKDYLSEETSIAADSSQMTLKLDVQTALSSERGIATRDFNDVKRR